MALDGTTGAAAVIDDRRRQMEAIVAEAMDNAQEQADLEDARIQYKNLSRNQAIVGLVQRRNTMRAVNNLRTVEQAAQLKGFNGGNYTVEYQQQVEQSLSSQENEALGAMTEKIMEQQAAAAGVAQGIRIAMPEHGRKLEFFRPIQIDPSAALAIEFHSARAGALGGAWRFAWPVLAMAVFFAILRGRRAPNA